MPLKTTNRILVSSCAFTWIVSSSFAQVTANFSDHTDLGTTYDFNNNTGQATGVDQYGGTAGNGWTGGWQISAASGVGDGTGSTYSSDKTVRNTTPVNGGGNYLQLSSTSTATSSPRWGAYREFGNNGTLNVNQAATVSFNYRMDDDSFYEGGGASFINIWGGADWIWNTQAVTWGIRSVYIDANTRNWAVIDGDGTGGVSSNINTGLEIVEGDTFSFEVDVDPAANSYTVSITNLDTAASYTSGTLGFALDQATIGQSIWFIQQVADLAGGDPSTFAASVDNISVVPEPSAYAILAGFLALGFVAVRRRR